METKWLEDFVSLAETRSFSRSAQLRHVTQPAFSRRIQALEAWTGVDLVDRSSYPTRLTPAGETFHAQALEILGALQATRNMMRSHLDAGQDMIEFALPHTLAFTFFPHWLMDAARALRPAQEPADRAQRARRRAAPDRRRLRPADRLPPRIAAAAAQPRALRDAEPGGRDLAPYAKSDVPMAGRCSRWTRQAASRCRC
jgi:DNA-binding transcriptional LysR family regulator